ncbi:MAG TPA: hypothetical protein VFW07_14095 [Parafilimonas sp.]|nr:hypothetical protein [Parafilimonas sp.]
MKPILLLTVFLVFTVNVYSQDTARLANLRDYYLQKSKTQRTTGFVLLGLGTAATIAGIVTINSSDSWGGSDVGGFLFLGGLTVDLLSIPFFVSAGNFKKFAAELELMSQKTYLLQKNAITAKYLPGITFKINF